MINKIKVYGRSNCRHCNEFKKVLDNLKIKYTYLNIDEDFEVISRARRKGISQLPIIEFLNGDLYEGNLDFIGKIKDYHIFIANVKNYVLEFYLTYKQDEFVRELGMTKERLKLRTDILQEEIDELEESLECNDIVESFDALGDIIYVMIGNYLEGMYSNYDSLQLYQIINSYQKLIESHYGIEIGIELLGDILKEIHKSNLSKLDENGNPVYREDGKVTKGVNFFPPNLKNILQKYKII